MKRRTLIMLAPALVVPAHAGIRPETRVTLIGGEKRGGVWQAGVFIETGEDWKTYWRLPGDAGIPPVFDWTGSDNLAAVEVRYPAPTRINDSAGESIGYKTRVLFPLSVTPRDAAAPVRLKLKLFFAVCKEICIPVDAEEMATISNADPGGASRIAAAEARVPVAGTPIRKARFADGALFFEMDQLAGLDIFVEGAEPAYVTAPEPAGGGYRLPVKGGASLAGRVLRVTMTGPNVLLEQTVTVE